VPHIVILLNDQQGIRIKTTVLKTGYAFVAGWTAFFCATDFAYAQSPVVSQEERYAACLAEASRRPADGFDLAGRWKDEGGGLPARHCAAVALINLGQPAEAGARLAELARASGNADAELRAALFAQSGNAWLLAEVPMQAADMFTHALGLSPGDGQILTDRARAFILLGKWTEAGKDLENAIAVMPQLADPYVVRAGLRRKAGDMSGAREDIALALSREPNNARALLERGVQRHGAGDIEGARADWLALIANAAETKKYAEDDLPESETLATARRYLEALDVEGAAPLSAGETGQTEPSADKPAAKEAP
jgi:tetratricopeptide (TPR) repeat protein